MYNTKCGVQSTMYQYAALLNLQRIKVIVCTTCFGNKMILILATRCSYVIPQDKQRLFPLNNVNQLVRDVHVYMHR